MTAPPEPAAPTLVYPTVAAVRDRRRGALLHWPARRQRWGSAMLASACSGQRLAREGGRSPEDVDDPARCAARGCAQRWALVDGTPSLFDTPDDPPI